VGLKRARRNFKSKGAQQRRGSMGLIDFLVPTKCRRDELKKKKKKSRTKISNYASKTPAGLADNQGALAGGKRAGRCCLRQKARHKRERRPAWNSEKKERTVRSRTVREETIIKNSQRGFQVRTRSAPHVREVKVRRAKGSACNISRKE